jgi:preprotein translocase subunit YajC
MITFAANTNSTNVAPLLISALAIAVLFFVMIVRPQKKSAQRHQSLIDALKVGDDIITNGGLYGAIKSIGDDTIELEIAKGTIVTLAKRSIAMKKVADVLPANAKSVESNPDDEKQVKGSKKTEADK